MKKLVLLLSCYIITVSTLPSHRARSVVGAIYKGPGSEIIIEGPDGSIITAQAGGGAVEIQPFAVIPNQPAPAFEISRDTTGLIGNVLPSPTASAIAQVDTVGPIIAPSINQVRTSAVSFSNPDAVIATSVAPQLLAQSTAVGVPEEDLSAGGLAVPVADVSATANPLSLNIEGDSTLATANIQQQGLIGTNLLTSNQQIALQIQEQEQIRAQQEAAAQERIALQIQAQQQVVRQQEVAARIRAQQQALVNIRVQEQAAAQIQAQQQSETQAQVQQGATAQQKSAVQVETQQQGGAQIQAQQSAASQDKRAGAAQQTQQQQAAEVGKIQQQLETEIRAQEQAVAAQRTQERVAISIQAQEQVAAQIRAQEQAAAEIRSREEAEAQRRAQQQTAEEIRAQEIAAAEERTRQRVQVQRTDQEVAALRAQQTAAETKAQQLATASAQAQQAAEAIRARLGGDRRLSPGDVNGRNPEQGVPAIRVTAENDPRLSTGPQIITNGNSGNNDNLAGSAQLVQQQRLALSQLGASPGLAAPTRLVKG